MSVKLDNSGKNRVGLFRAFELSGGYTLRGSGSDLCRSLGREHLIPQSPNQLSSEPNA